jgi:hypothetical protein
MLNEELDHLLSSLWEGYKFFNFNTGMGQLNGSVGWGIYKIP